MQHQCKVTVLDTTCSKALQQEYLADPESGPCPCFKTGDEFLFQRTPEHDDYYHLGRGTRVADGGDWPCGEAWDAINRYIYTALQGGSIGWEPTAVGVLRDPRYGFEEIACRMQSVCHTRC